MESKIGNNMKSVANLEENQLWDIIILKVDFTHGQ